ncbi:hypothetical protein ACFL2A_00090 [Thermodesulfobacteriota bacterium]
MKIEKLKIIKDVAKRIYLNYNVLNLSKIICELENASTQNSLRKIFIQIEKTAPYGLNVDDIVHTFFNEINERKIEVLVDILVIYLYEFIKSNDVNNEYYFNKA